MKKLIFSTSVLNQLDTTRQDDWLKYYKPLFPNYDFWFYNDGPVLDIERPIFKEFNCDIKFSLPYLGRQGNIQYPGWKRSMRDALTLALNYDRVIYIESDFYIRPKYIDLYRTYFEKDGTYSVWCKNHNWMETSFVIFNDKNIVQQLVNLFSSDEELHRNNIAAETQIFDLLKPTIISDSFRIEGVDPATLIEYNDNLQTMANFDYNKFSRYL